MTARRRFPAGGHGSGQSGHGGAGTERYLITYADLITLLMVFFIIMFAMSRADGAKFATLSEALERAFNIGVFGAISTSPGRGRGVLLPQDFSGIPQQVIGEDYNRLRTQLIQVAEGLSAPGAITVTPSREGIIISLSGNLLFDSGRADLRPEGIEVLKVLGEELRKMPNDVRVEGHTDNVPIHTALYASNWELSVARAVAVTRYLSEVVGVAPSRLSAVGYGEFRPVADNSTREGRARNRRADIVILYPQQPQELTWPLGAPSASQSWLPEPTPVMRGSTPAASSARSGHR
jgi:chemotaxis protein MotB